MITSGNPIELHMNNINENVSHPERYLRPHSHCYIFNHLCGYPATVHTVSCVQPLVFVSSQRSIRYSFCEYPLWGTFSKTSVFVHPVERPSQTRQVWKGDEIR